MNSSKKGEGVPLLNFDRSPGIPLLNFEGGLRVPFLNFRGVPGSTFKLWRGSGVSGPEVLGPGILVPLLHDAKFPVGIKWEHREEKSPNRIFNGVYFNFLDPAKNMFQNM